MLMTDIDDIDLKILGAISDLKVSYPNADKIKKTINLTPDDLEARLGVLEAKGYIKTLKGTFVPKVSLPKGIYAAGLTDSGNLIVIKSKSLQ